MRITIALLLLAACASGDPKPDHPVSSGSGSDPATNPSHPGETGQQGMVQDQTPGNTGVDEHGVLLRSKPDPDAPKPDPALVADDDANTLFYAAGLAGDPALQKRALQQLGLFDASGAPTPKFQPFLLAQQEWVKTHGDKAAAVNTPATAKAYVTAHLK